MRSSLVVLLLASLPCGVLAQSDRDWRLCRAVDADHLAILACTRLIDSSGLSERDRATAHVIRGSAHWRQRDFDQAIADENEAIRIDPNLAAAYVARSAAYGSKADDDQAIADANKALDIDPNIAAAHLDRGIARGHKGDVDGAIADTTRAVELDPHNALGLISLGTLHAKKREPGLAYADFGNATEIEPGGGFDGYRVRGMAFERRSDFRHAIADFSRWIEIDPACAFAYALRADALLRNDEHAFADATRAIDINPRSAVGHEIRGRIYAFRRDPARAADDFAAWIETEPNNASAYHLRGRVYTDNYDYDRDRGFHQGDRDRARQRRCLSRSQPRLREKAEPDCGARRLQPGDRGSEAEDPIQRSPAAVSCGWPVVHSPDSALRSDL